MGHIPKQFCPPLGSNILWRVRKKISRGMARHERVHCDSISVPRWQCPVSNELHIAPNKVNDQCADRPRGDKALAP